MRGKLKIRLLVEYGLPAHLIRWSGRRRDCESQRDLKDNAKKGEREEREYSPRQGVHDTLLDYKAHALRSGSEVRKMLSSTKRINDMRESTYSRNYIERGRWDASIRARYTSLSDSHTGLLAQFSTVENEEWTVSVTRFVAPIQ